MSAQKFVLTSRYFKLRKQRSSPLPPPPPCDKIRSPEVLYVNRDKHLARCIPKVTYKIPPFPEMKVPLATPPRPATERQSEIWLDGGGYWALRFSLVAKTDPPRVPTSNPGLRWEHGRCSYCFAHTHAHAGRKAPPSSDFRPDKNGSEKSRRPSLSQNRQSIS